MQLVDKNGFASSIGPRGVRVMVTPQDALSGGSGVTTPRGGKKNSSAAKKYLSKKATHNPEITMPKFSLDLKIQGPPQRNGGDGSTSRADKAEQERAARIAKEGVALVVRAEASDLDIAGVSSVLSAASAARPCCVRACGRLLFLVERGRVCACVLTTCRNLSSIF